MSLPHNYQSPPQQLALFNDTPQSILQIAKEACERRSTLYDELVAEVSVDRASFDNVIRPIAAAENERQITERRVCFYKDVSDDKTLRDASSEASQILANAEKEAYQRQDIFNLIDAVYKHRNNERLDPESIHFLEDEYREYSRNGLGLEPGHSQVRFKQIQSRIVQIEAEFRKNLNEEKSCVWLTPAELGGVSPNYVDALEKGAGENEGKLRVSLADTDIFAVCGFAEDADIRRQVFLANETKCGSNVPLFKELIVLRDEAARILGYSNHASFQLQNSMAKSPEAVETFLNGLIRSLHVRGREEVARLSKLKETDAKARGISYDGSFYLWDHVYYTQLLLKKEYAFDGYRFSEYFPAGPTVESMLNIFGELLGFVFVKLGAESCAALSPTGEAKHVIWHEAVLVYSVWNDSSEGGGFAGYLYLDLHPRQGKYGHAAKFTVQRGFLKDDGTRSYPASALVCNLTKPTAGKPSLLKHHELIRLFHELGHCLHDLASTCTYSRFHGTATVSDFVEAPSQMLENWFWDPKVVRSVSSHYDTGEKIPDDLVKSLISTKYTNKAVYNLRQACYGLFDMAVHAPKRHEDVENMRVSEVYNQLLRKLGIKGPKVQGEKDGWGNGHVITIHHVKGSYYRYQWSKRFGEDMFSVGFKSDPMNGKEGRRYRHTVLEKGGSEDANLLVTQFLGREPNSGAFIASLGIDQ
ncbi:Saccharolysin [Colletotrichum fructicola Nara gc5]|uniref:Metallopeptidase n=1 Tax=Colletotrichum fructicola (strain Nara gc5) TaxID=1213859 RepID=L2FUG1_COLFN|nr:Saccharolysin [Colletotrichum fructicola Nara gc5]KAF4881127.1 Saccharolysin [Colletotrichum fructicola]